MRYIFLSLVLAASLVAGFWFRGDEDRGVSPAAVIVLSACVLGADLLGSPKSRPARMGAAVVAGMLFAVGWYFGGRELDNAIDDCAHRVEEVRMALADYEERTGSYPDSLDQLTGIELPGKRLLRPSPLRYLRTNEGYVLWYRDGRLEFSATDDHQLTLERRYE